MSSFLFVVWHFILRDIIRLFVIFIFLSRLILLILVRILFILWLLLSFKIRLFVILVGFCILVSLIFYIFIISVFVFFKTFFVIFVVFGFCIGICSNICSLIWLFFHFFHCCGSNRWSFEIKSYILHFFQNFKNTFFVHTRNFVHMSHLTSAQINYFFNFNSFQFWTCKLTQPQFVNAFL